MKSANEFVLIALALVGVVAVFTVDMVSPLGFTFWILYFVPIGLMWQANNPALPLVAAAAVLTAVTIGFFYSADGLEPSVAAVNRIMASLMLSGVAVAGRYFILGRHAVNDANWVQQGQVAIARSVQGELSPERLAQQTLEVLGNHTGAKAAVFYLRQPQGLTRIGAWGADTSALPREMPADEGHIGRAIREKDVLEVIAGHNTTLKWASGLMSGKVASSALVPLSEGGHVNGVIEIGFDHSLTPAARLLMERVGEKVAIALRSAQYRQRAAELLEETQRQAEELRNQADELTSTNTELEEQTQALLESQRKLEEQQAELEEQNTQLESQTQQLEEQRDALARSRRQLEEQSDTLARESQYKSEFVANMSHELRTPLNALLIMSRLLAENRAQTMTDEQIRWASTIESSGQDLLALINDILDLSKIESGKLDLETAETDPQVVARKLVRGFEAQARAKGLALKAEVAKSAGVLDTDVTRLEQILRNFLSNALKFTEKGSVTLKVSGTADSVKFAVRDTGIGIDQTQQDAVFEAFRQADGTISRRYGGTGLGLSISRELADLLGGEITLESEPGKGSTFAVTLPRRMEDQPAPTEAPRVPTAARPAEAPSLAVAGGPLAPALDGVVDDRDSIQPGDRVMLVVEDDAAFAQILSELARELGFRAVCVSRAEDAIRAARHYTPHAVVLDVGLPDHSGLTVLDQLKRDVSTRHIPVHMVSAEDYTREALAQGAISYMMKPVQREDLAQAFQQLEARLEQRMRRVLIVEDDPVQLDGLQSLLGSDEVETVGAASAAEAVAEYRKGRFDCIVLDMTLPDASGFDVLETLDSDEGAGFPPVIIYTARSLSEAEEQRLRRYSKSIIIKGAKSPERLIDEVTLFLHQVVSDLPDKQRKMLAASLNRDALLEGRRILVVEDDIRNVYALTGIFEPHGATVQIARNGREALDTLGRIADGAQPKVDLVLMDVMMPEMDGLTATREIRKIDRWKSLPIIMLTAKAMAGDQNECIEAGANDYLAKPIDVDKLLSLARVWMPR
ncbi:response regulator [Cereibacter sphaeroides]|nr:response regulator [Cereibacter sphaeroides]